MCIRDRYLGNQILKVEITGGEQKGEIIEVSNYLTKTHNVYAQNGMKLIINADTPKNAEPYYTVYNLSLIHILHLNKM